MNNDIYLLVLQNQSLKILAMKINSDFTLIETNK